MTSIVIVAVLTQGVVVVGMSFMLAVLVGRFAPRPGQARPAYPDFGQDFGHDEGGPRDREANADSFRDRVMAYRPQVFDQDHDQAGVYRRRA